MPLITVPKVIYKPKDLSYIGYYDYNSASVTSLTEDVWAKLNTNTTLRFSKGSFTHSNNRATYTGANTIIVFLQAICTITTNSETQFHFAFFQDGVIIPCSEQNITTIRKGANYYTNACPIHCMAELSQNNYIEVYIKNSENNADPTLDNVNVVINEL